MNAPRARLLCRTGQFAGATYELGADNTIGREDGNDVVLLANTVSSRHARIFWKDGAFFLEDLGSRNGTLLDGIQVTEPQRLDTLNVITVSDAYDLVFEAAGTGAVTPATQAATPAAAAPKPPPPPPPTPEPPTPEPSPPVAVEPPLPPEGPATASRTRVDLAAFGPLPDLNPVPPEAGTPVTPSFYLVIEVTGEPPREEDLPAAGGTLGRSEECDMIINHESLSRRHAEIGIEQEKLVLKDLGSTNGTFVDDREISQVALSPGDTFRLGSDVRVRIEKR